jgi:hypothetical protein
MPWMKSLLAFFLVLCRDAKSCVSTSACKKRHGTEINGIGANTPKAVKACVSARMDRICKGRKFPALTVSVMVKKKSFELSEKKEPDM